MLGDESSLEVSHLVVRGTYLPNTVRCTTGDLFRPQDYLARRTFGIPVDTYSFKCYIDMRVNSYILGSGPSSLSVIFFILPYVKGDYADENRTWQEGVEALRQVFEADFAPIYAGREHVVPLSPPHDLSSLAWRLGPRWDVQRKDDGTVIAVHPSRDLWRRLRPDDYQTHRATLEMELPAFTQAVTTAHQARVTEYEGRIGADEDLPALVTNANELRDYYTAARVPSLPDDPAQPPPPCGLAVPDQAGNPGLMADCMTLLAAKDTLRGTATLNWGVDTPIANWDGVTVRGTPSRVAEVGLRERGLTGEVPAELGDLTSLTRLRLGVNQLTGTIPAQLGELSGLLLLNLSNNQLTGAIPAELGGLANLTHLTLFGNLLTGAAPTQLGSLANLQALHLSDNRLTGGIPAELGGLSNLTDLYLDRNQLTEAIPSQLGRLTSLRTLSLDSNQLAGAIPAELGGLSNLTRLYLDYNRLTGAIPAELGGGGLSNLEYLSLDANQLTGAIPAQLGNLTSLQTLWLSGNGLTGCHPFRPEERPRQRPGQGRPSVLRAGQPHALTPGPEPVAQGGAAP